MNFILNILIVFSLFFVAPEKEDKISIIVNKDVPDKELDKGQILDIYTLNTNYWSDGSRIALIDYNGMNTTKQKYYDYLGISYSKIQKIWLRKQFSGKAQPPITYRTEKEVVDIVAETSGAIGYVSSKKVSSKVRVIATIE